MWDKSLVKYEYDDLNPYMLDDETKKKLNTTHYVLGEDNLRDLQNRHAERMKKVQELADRLGVEVVNHVVDKDQIVKENEMFFEYQRNKILYDAFLRKSLEIMPIEMLYEYLVEKTGK